MAARLTLLCLLLPALALGHGAIPAVTDIRVRPGDTSTLFIETNFGALLSTDGGAHFDLICEFVLSPAVAGDPELLVTADGTLFAASTTVGLRVSRNGGCTFDAIAELDEQRVAAIVGHPAKAETVLIATSKPGAPGKVLRSDDTGVVFAPTPLASATESYTSIVAAADRLYVAGWWHSPASAWLHRSDDDGESFASVAVPVEAGASFKVLGVSPVDSAIVYAVILGDFDVTVLRSEQAGDGFVPVLEGTEEIREIEHSEDGKTVWLAGTHRLYRSTDAGETFAMLPAPELDACVREIFGVLWTCGYQPLHEWALATSTDLGTTLAPRFRFDQVRGVLACPEGTDTHDVCEPDWPKMKSFFGIFDAPPQPEVTPAVEDAPDTPAVAETSPVVDAPPAVDAGSADTAVSAPPPPASSGGCTTGAPAPAAWLGALVFMAILLLRYSSVLA